MNIAICDDEQTCIDEISERLRCVADSMEEKCTIISCDSGEKLIDLCKSNAIDAVFLDIAMPDVNGFKTAERLMEIQKNLILVFVSNNDNMVYLSYEYRPFWFVPKSQIDMLDMVFKKIIRKIRFDKKCNDNVHILTGKAEFVVDVLNTAYFVTDDHYVQMVMINKQKSESYRCRLKDIESRLSESWFVRSHNRYLVNYRMVRVIEKSTLILKNGEEIPISRSRVSDVKSGFQNYLRSIR